MTRRGWRLLWAMIGVGALARVIVAFDTYGVVFDIQSYQIVGDAFLDGGLFSTYDQISQGDFTRWPYPPGYWPFIYAAIKLDDLVGLPLQGTIQLPAIAADAAIALLVVHYLGWRGASERTQLAGGGLVALGPSFAFISGYHGHFDAVAILPAVAALILWEREGQSRALWAGLLIGVGAAFKSVPILMLIALLPTARSPREGATLVAAAVAVPLALLLPFALVDLHPIWLMATYRGVGGIGGLSLVVQPGLADLFVRGDADVGFSSATEVLLDYGSFPMLGALALVAGLTLRRRTPALQAACLVWLVPYVFGNAFVFQYIVWGVPFFLMAGYLREVLALQAALAIAFLLLRLGPWEDPLATVVYVALMLAAWAALLVALIAQLRAVAGRASPVPQASG
jgi:hypothetical protein